VGGVCPADEALGISQSSVSVGARELCTLMGIATDFDQSRRDLKRVGGLSLSKERMRQVTEGEGRNVAAVRDGGRFPAAWSAPQAKLPDGQTRLYAGVDGVMTPTVTQAEKDKRRKNHAIRRQQRSAAGVGNLKPLPPPKAGADEKYKEKKVGVFYNQDKTLRHVFVTAGTCEAVGPLLKSHAAQVGFEKADQTVCLIDGAVWIYRQVCLALACVQSILLDFYHLAEHVHAASRCCFGEVEARAWASKLLSLAKASDVQSLLREIDALDKRARSPVKKKGLAALRFYISERRHMLRYAQALEARQDIGSGPTEAACKTVTLRLKRPGMKWDDDNAAAVMNILAMRESGQWDDYWQAERQKAA